MKSKFAMMLMAAVGSSTLVASAQPPYPPAQYEPVSRPPSPDTSRSLFAPVAVPQPPPPPGPPVLAPSLPGADTHFALPLIHGGPGWGGRGPSAEEANL